MRCSRYLLCILFFALASYPTIAQTFSYVYIQGDKQTPFYVKLEDQMQPRYGKNYSIISQLSAGLINIEILFQQNIYPSQKFTIKVPDNGFRGFLLTRKGNAFSLYDIQQQFYLPAGNKESDDRMPGTSIPIETATATTETKEEPVSANSTTTTAQPQGNATPVFMGDIELNSEKAIQAQTMPDKTDSTADTATVANTIYNSDCPTPVGATAFEDIYNKLQEHNDNTKLKFLLSKLDRCYTTNQIRILTKGLADDPDRFEFLKQAYRRVTNQSEYPMLESLLSTPEWKEQFKQLIK